MSGAQGAAIKNLRNLAESRMDMERPIFVRDDSTPNCVTFP